MKKYFLIILALSFLGTLSAQKKRNVNYLETVFPTVVLDSVRYIYIEPFKNSAIESASPTAAATFKHALADQLRKAVFGDPQLMRSQYANTDWYVITEDISLADAIISGTYTLNLTEKRDFTDVVKQHEISYQYRSPYYKRFPDSKDFIYPVPEKHTVPVAERTYKYENSVGISARITITNKNGKELYSQDISKSDAYVLPDITGRPYVIPASKQINVMLNGVISLIAAEFAGKIMPTNKAYVVTLAEVVPSDKDLKKVVKKLDFETTEQLLEATGVYKKVYDMDKSKEAAGNIARLYYILGYYPEAEEWYKTAALTEDWILKNINYNRQIRAKLGAPLKERFVIYP